ncbi:MAG: hypothetical protein JXB48_01080 [Candidatus Latescibacteria bacterium]|nr:hypothetical protein [Candidatus Latescibacterota bacterium]
MKLKTACVLCTLMIYSSVCSAESGFNVLDFGASGDGITDNTGEFQKALDEASKSGTVVHVPAGQYRFDGNLVIPENTTLEGVWEGYHFANGDKGSALLIYSGRDRENAEPFMILNSNSTVKGLSFIYPEQKGTDIHPYPWTLQARTRAGVTGKCNIIDVSIANAYNGIDCGTFANGGTYVRNIHMCALRRGLYIDRSSDIGRFENIQIVHMGWGQIGEPWKPTREEYQAFMKYMLENLEGFILGRCDWTFMVNCFVLKPKIGFVFKETELRPDENPGKRINQPNILITQSGSDMGPLAVKIEKLQDHAGIAFENCQFMNSIEIGEQNTGPLKLTNCGFWGECRTGSVIVNKGSGEVMLTSCHFSTWEDPNRKDFAPDPKVPLIDMYDGSLLLTSCVFKDYQFSPDNHIHLGENVKSTIFMGNMVHEGKLRINNQSKGDIRLVGNITD